MSISRLTARLNTYLISSFDILFHLSSNSYLLFRFIASKTGREYGIGRLHKLQLAMKLIQNKEIKIKRLRGTNRRIDDV